VLSSEQFTRGVGPPCRFHGVINAIFCAYCCTGFFPSAPFLIEGNALVLDDSHELRFRSASDGSHDEEFVRLLTQHQSLLFEYLVAALGQPLDAEEVLQETIVILWRERASFTLGTNFVGWSVTIARNQVRKFRRSEARHAHLPADDILEELAGEVAAEGIFVDDRQRAFEHCLELLRDRDRRFLMDAYSSKGTKKELAETLGMPLDTMYTTLSRLRRRLFECIERRVAMEGQK
jgi:RNA polymerase sigma-70 factor (ECF subfamily)